MGPYLNPGNSGFSVILNTEYVDKTGLISLINRTINTGEKLTCISRPRRFGKSYAAQMLSAYYDKSCDSGKLFEKLKIAEDESYKRHLNKYDVIYLDMTGVMGETAAEDLVTFRGKDDVLTLLIHLGYLAYDAEKGSVRIPNEEIKQEFRRAIREVDHAETRRRLEESEKLFLDTINGNEEAVAAQIEKVHAEETSPLHYNKEDSLRSVIKLAYYTYRDNYLQWEELPAGEGFADIVYFPKHDSDWPALVVELKWNKSAEGAIDQILKKKYPEALKDYGSEIVLVGINYDKDAEPGNRKHSCRIEKV